MIAQSRALRARKNFSAGSNFWNSPASDRSEGASCAFNEASAAPQMNTRAAVERNVMEGLTIILMLYELISRTVRREWSVSSRPSRDLDKQRAQIDRLPASGFRMTRARRRSVYVHGSRHLDREVD